jgi:hypothetical protein
VTRASGDRPRSLSIVVLVRSIIVLVTSTTVVVRSIVVFRRSVIVFDRSSSSRRRARSRAPMVTTVDAIAHRSPNDGGH